MYELLAQGLISHLGLAPAIVRPEATFDELGLDSLAMVELVLVLEDEYGIEAEGIDPAGTLAQAAAHLEQAASGEPSPAGSPNPVGGTP
ncbi:acyl carrier protein [Streptomyces sp. NPDC057426]